jgi:hypothetical protein
VTTLELANAVQSRFATQVVATQAIMTIYDNDPTPAPTQALVWCRFTVKDGAARRIAVGAKEYRREGVAIAQLFGRLGEGTAGVRTVADAVIAAFQDKNAGGVRYGVPYVDNIGDTKDGSYQLNVYCPFSADTIET